MGKNRVCEILGIEKPIIQGPMVWLTSPELCAAVSNAGGLGVLGFCGGFEEKVFGVERTIEEMRKSIRRIKELTDKPFGINIYPSSNKPGDFTKPTIELCKEEGVKILVCVGKISPNDYKEWKKDGFIVIVREMNPTVRGAIEAEKAGADIIVATGCDEGGTMPVGATGTMAIVALLADAVNIPVLAAGGIVNEKFARATAILGAEGAFVGTRFILSKECRAAQATKDNIMNTHPDDFIVLDIFNGFAKCRTTPTKFGINGLTENKNGNKNTGCGDFYAGMFKGDIDKSVVTVNNVTSLIKSIDSCEDIVNELARGYEN